ncbi:MAG: hypothetical protein CMB80_05530 [Flammeovirgaceae bacterium]|nr:hypothetical protein [Flammeovirgaceae bacterium]|tara:strand:+ start:9392 stop:10297 length:906 start_codon:yes stop_codon:yes gene_type:complete
MLDSFAKIYTVGDRETVDLFKGDVTITEKIDGSFFAFGIEDGKLAFRSRRTVIQPNTVDGLFGKTVVAVTEREELIRGFELETPGITFYGEAVNKPKHNKIAYEIAPNGNIVLWGVRFGDVFFDHHAVIRVAEILALPVTQLLTVTPLTVEHLEETIKSTPSMLGGQMEGVVIRSHDHVDVYDNLPIHAKLVGQAFREKMESKSTSKKPTLGKIYDLFDDDAKAARWRKAIQHMDEEGRLTGTVRDIGPMMGELARDFKEESHDDIKEMLYKIFMPDIIKHVQSGAPDWYKRKLQDDMEGQ